MNPQTSSTINPVDIPDRYAELVDTSARYIVLYGGRGAARSWTIARLLLLSSIERKERILCTRELQKSIKQSVHRLLCDQIKYLGYDSWFRITETKITGKNGSEFMFLGLRANPEEVKSTEGITSVWIEEAENLTESSWDILDPTVRTEQSKIYISFNTRYKFDHVYQTFIANKPPENSKIIKASYKDNPWFPQVLKKQMEQMKERDYEKYLNIWEGDIKNITEGSIYKSQLTTAKKDGRILDFPITNNEVFTFFDLGKSDATSIWFMQQVGLEYRFIDYYEDRLREIPHYAKVLRGIAPLDMDAICPITDEVNARRANYNYGGHYMPHDISHNMLGMAQSRREQFENGGSVSKMEAVKRLIEMWKPKTKEGKLYDDQLARAVMALGGEVPEGRRMYGTNPRRKKYPMQTSTAGMPVRGETYKKGGKVKMPKGWHV